MSRDVSIGEERKMLRPISTPPSAAYFNEQNPPRHYECSGILGLHTRFRLEIFGDRIRSNTLAHLIAHLELLGKWLREDEAKDSSAGEVEVASWNNKPLL
jgi:hypothetical protein